MSDKRSGIYTECYQCGAETEPSHDDVLAAGYATKDALDAERAKAGALADALRAGIEALESAIDNVGVGHTTAHQDAADACLQAALDTMTTALAVMKKAVGDE